MPKPKPITTDYEFLTPLQVACLLQVKESTVRQWLRKRSLQGFKIGRDWRISKAAIMEFAERECI